MPYENDNPKQSIVNKNYRLLFPFYMTYNDASETASSKDWINDRPDRIN